MWYKSTYWKRQDGFAWSSSRSPMRRCTLTYLFPLMLVVGAGCSKSPESPVSPPESMSPHRAPSPSPRPVRDAAAVAPTRLERMLSLPARLVPDPERIRFLVFGDSRAERCRCDPNRKHRKRCRVLLVPDAAKATEDCALVAQAPALVLGAVTDRLRPTTATTGADRAQFSLFTGDLVYRGSCPKDWDWVRRVFLAQVDPSRVFPIIGNHDAWRRAGEPPPFPQFFRAFPHLRVQSQGRSVHPHYYAFRVGRSLFVNLCTGGYPRGGTRADFERADRSWLCVRASFETQMRWMDRVLALGATQGVRHVFVQYHKPSFSCSSHPPLGVKHDPLTRLRSFKKSNPRVNVIAFSGHNHTTEVYLSGGVLVLVAGGGGAPQHLHHGPRACHEGKPGQPPERFWKGGVRTVRYNYFQVDVIGGRLSIQEHCLARNKDRLLFQKGSRITATGQITHTPGACNLTRGRR